MKNDGSIDDGEEKANDNEAMFCSCMCRILLDLVRVWWNCIRDFFDIASVIDGSVLLLNLYIEFKDPKSIAIDALGWMLFLRDISV